MCFVCPPLLPLPSDRGVAIELMASFGDDHMTVGSMKATCLKAGLFGVLSIDVDECILTSESHFSPSIGDSLFHDPAATFHFPQSREPIYVGGFRRFFRPDVMCFLECALNHGVAIIVNTCNRGGFMAVLRQWLTVGLRLPFPIPLRTAIKGTQKSIPYQLVGCRGRVAGRSNSECTAPPACSG